MSSHLQDGRPSGKAEAMHLDLTSFQSITDFAKAFKAKKLPLHTLVNNAGVFLVPHDFTQEGFETTVGTNYFGHFLLTHLLLDTIKASAPARHAIFLFLSSLPCKWFFFFGARKQGYSCVPALLVIVSTCTVVEHAML